METQKRNQDTPNILKKQKKNKEKQEKEVDDWRTRINWEKIHKTISVIVLILVPFFVRDMFNFRAAVVEQGHSVMPWSYMGQVLLSTLIFTIVRKAYFMGTHNFILSKILPQYTGEDRVLHTKKVQKWTFDCLYYTLTSIYGFVYFRHSTWYPLNMSQKEEDDTLGLLSEWPNQPVNQSYFGDMNFFLIVQFGHHTWGVLDLIFVRRKQENRFYEWFLHHILAWTLIFYSSYFNYTILAVSVLIIHDIGDIFIVMFKTYGEFSSKGLTFKYLVFQMIVGWFISRVYLFPKVLIYPIITYKQLYAGGEIWEIAKAGYVYQTVMLMVLYFLHLYWFAQMITLLISYITKSLKEGRKKKQEEGYGNEWDYYHYNKDENEQQQQEQSQQQQQELKKEQ